MAVDKKTGLHPAEELGCPRGRETFCVAGLNIAILLRQQSSEFDGTCQPRVGLGGWSSPLVRQLSAPAPAVGDLRAAKHSEVSADFQNNSTSSAGVEWDYYWIVESNGVRRSLGFSCRL